MKPFLDSIVEFFDRASVPPQIQELLDEWPEIDPGTARLVRAAVMSREPRRLRQAWERHRQLVRLRSKRYAQPGQDALRATPKRLRW